MDAANWKSFVGRLPRGKRVRHSGRMCGLSLTDRLGGPTSAPPERVDPAKLTVGCGSAGR